MSSATYSQLELQRLSEEELRRVIIEQGWFLPSNRLDRSSLIALISTKQQNQSRFPASFSAGLMTGAIEEAVGQLQDFYQMKLITSTQLLALSDSALFAVVDRLGYEIDLAPPYARIGNIQFRDRYDLVWYLIGRISQ